MTRRDTYLVHLLGFLARHAERLLRAAPLPLSVLRYVSWLAPAAQAGDRADQLHRGIQRLIEAEPRLETVAGRIGDGELHGIQAGILWPRRHGQMPMLYTANIHHHVPVPLNRERGRMYQHYFCRI
jgi:hypothetical protein